MLRSFWCLLVKRIVGVCRIAVENVEHWLRSVKCMMYHFSLVVHRILNKDKMIQHALYGIRGLSTDVPTCVSRNRYAIYTPTHKKHAQQGKRERQGRYDTMGWQTERNNSRRYFESRKRLEKRSEKWSTNTNCRKNIWKIETEIQEKISARINEKLE